MSETGHLLFLCARASKGNCQKEYCHEKKRPAEPYLSGRFYISVANIGQAIENILIKKHRGKLR